MAAFKSRSSGHSIYYTEPITCPTLHVFGDTDRVIPKGMYSAGGYFKVALKFISFTPHICLKMSYLFRTMNLYHAYGSNTSLNPTSKFGCTEISLQNSLNLSYKLPLPSVLHLSLHSPSLVLWHWARVRN